VTSLRVGRITIPATELSWRSVRSSGPGGQNVNKVASKVELRFDLERTTALDGETKARLRELARTRLDADGMIMVISQLTRDRARNLEDARDKLALLVARAMIRPKKRKPTKPSRGAKERRLTDKRKTSEKKQTRGRPGD
jgi:ribosome-associated protein